MFIGRRSHHVAALSATKLATVIVVLVLLWPAWVVTEVVLDLRLRDVLEPGGLSARDSFWLHLVWVAMFSVGLVAHAFLTRYFFRSFASGPVRATFADLVLPLGIAFLAAGVIGRAWLLAGLVAALILPAAAASWTAAAAEERDRRAKSRGRGGSRGGGSRGNGGGGGGASRGSGSRRRGNGGGNRSR